MKRMCAALVAAVAFAQAPPSDKPSTIEGRVVNSITGEAVRKADVTLTKDPTEEEFIGAQLGFNTDAQAEPGKPKRTFSATSDAAGKFRFEQLEHGDYLVIVKHAGFVALTYRATGAKRTERGLLHLRPDEQLQDFELRLIPQGAAAGKVIDEDGDPVADAAVTASTMSYASGRRKLEIRGSESTNDRGEFRMGKLPPGRYYISAQRANLNPTAAPPADGSPETNYVRTYYPRALDPAEAAVVEVRAGTDEPGLTIQLRKSRVVRIKGVAMGPDGKPLIGAVIMLMPAGQLFSSWSVTAKSPDGRFEVANVPPGLYRVIITQMADRRETEQSLFVPAENLTGVKLGTLPEGTVQGRVKVTGDGKIAVKGLSVTLLPDEDSDVMPANETTDENGAFVLKKVVPMRYLFGVYPLPPGTYLKSVLWNGKETLGDPFDFSMGAAAELQVFLGADSGAFDATVSRDDIPLPDAIVVLMPEDPSRRNSETVRLGTTNSAGRTALKDVPPGDYLAIAWEKIEEGGWFDPVVWKVAESSAIKITIGPKDSQQANLKAIPAH